MSSIINKALYLVARWSLDYVARCKLTQKEIQRMEAAWDIVKSEASHE